MMRGARRGCVRLRGAVIGIDDEDDSTFTITTSSSKDDPKTFHFQTRNSDERERWVRALEDTILRHSHTVVPSNILCNLNKILQFFERAVSIFIEIVCIDRFWYYLICHTWLVNLI